MTVGRIPSVEGGIQPTIVTTKGDIIVATGNASLVRQGVGANGTVLTANSAQADGVEWVSALPSQSGQSGNYLTTNGTAASWGAISAGGMTLLSTTTFNGAPITTLSSIPSGYNDLRVVIRLALPATDSVGLWVRVNSDSNANRHELATSNTTINAGNANTFASTEWRISNAIDNAVTNGLFVLDFVDYANTSTWKIAKYVFLGNDATTSTSFKLFNGTGLYNQTAAISSLQFLWSTGNSTSGTILLYGVK